MMSKSKLTKWDSAEYLKTDEDILHYIEACLEENDPQLITHALGVIAKAKGMSQLARDTGMTREGLYKALSDDGNPEFSTVMKVIKGLGLKVSIQPV
jgi:probable addiction module antidote protein